MSNLIAQYRKFVVAATGAVAQVIALNVLSGTALHDAQIAVAVGTALGVGTIPNGVATAASDLVKAAAAEWKAIVDAVRGAPAPTAIEAPVDDRTAVA